MDRPALRLGDYYQLLLRRGLLAGPVSPALDLTRPVSSVVCDSRAAVPGSLFLCKGAAFREEYLAQAGAQGAVAYMSEREYASPLPRLPVADIRAAMGWTADLCWGHPSGQIQVVGITGTKGKTTTAYFLAAILNAWRQAQGLHPVGLLSTLITDDGALRASATLTTPEPLELQRHLWNAVNAGCGYVVMECSSQALKYGRMTGVELAAAAFLNIGEDHISPREHPTPEDYFQSKLKIFDLSRAAVVNLDAQRAGEILTAAGRCGQVGVYSLSRVRELTPTEEGAEFSLRMGDSWERFSIPMAGEFNVSNALCAISLGTLLGAPVWAIRQGLAQTRVPGRMESCAAGGKRVIVDYAHNGMALEALLREVRRSYPGAQLTVVFGCVGDKALDRREGMGRAAGRWADRTILTEDDPGSEDVEEICRQIGGYVSAAGGNYSILPDREEAVRTAIETARAPAVIVLAGKGAEQAQKRKNGPEPCVPDGLLARKYLGLPLG